MKQLRNLLSKNFHYLCIVSVITLGLITIIGSGGGGGGGSTPTPSPTCVDVSGTWNTTESVNATDCGDGTYTDTNQYIVTQSGCNITVDAGVYGIHSGTVNGSQITYTGSYPEEGGTTTINVNLTISGNSLSGSSTWTWRDATSSCSGSSQISGTRSPGTTASCDGPVPCLTTDWGNLYREFEELDGSPILVLSYGDIFAGAGIDDFNRILSLGGTVTDCYNGEITLAGIDLNGDGILQDPGEFFDASGNAKICDRTLTVTNLIIDGAAENDIEATYVGTYTASVHITSEVPPEILFETMDKLKED